MPDRYHTPAEGTENWDDPLNANFSNLDIDVEHRDSTDPDTAGATPANGAKWLDTSTGEIYLADGTSWTMMWDLGAIGSGGGGDVLGSASDPIDMITNTHYREVTNEASVTGDYTVDLTVANVHKLTLTGDTTLTFTGDHSDLTTGATLIIQQDSTGGHSLSWANSIYWAGGTEPSPSTNAGDRHKYVVENVAGEWEAAVVAENLQLITDLTIDDWEHGDHTLYYTQALGTTETWNTDANPPVIEGDYSLKGSSLSSADMWISLSGEGLNYYPAAGDIISAYLHDGSGSAQTQVQYGWYANRSNGGNCYAVNIDAVNNRLELRDWTDGSSTQHDVTSVTISADTWYDVETEIASNDTYTCYVYDIDQSTGDRNNPDSPLASVSTTDSTHSANDGVMVGNRYAGGGAVNVDRIRKVGEL